MMRLPLFQYRAPRSLSEASRILEGEGAGAMLLAGGTDLLPNMKRRQQVPGTLVALRHVKGLRETRLRKENGLALGPCLTIAELVRNSRIKEQYTALWQAASQIATPHIRNMGTLGGNLCLDTRCNYYNQSYEWRKAIDFCIKKEGDICWVATGSRRCVAVSSTDTAPALMALGARLRLVSQRGERELELVDFYRNDGIEYLTRRPDEILSEVLLDSLPGWRSTYWKLRRRGSFDFPVLSVAAAARIDAGGVVENARVVIGSAASCPVIAAPACEFLAGKLLDDETIEEAATLAARVAKPLDNTDFAMGWRKKVTREFAAWALRDLRGDDTRLARERLVRHSLFYQA
jgi:4-hydroxybenzoyl-CoA reductase subunit beta